MFVDQKYPAFYHKLEKVGQEIVLSDFLNKTARAPDR